jgi:hypothetical protein
MTVTLTDATFRQGCGENALAPGLGCNQFGAWTADDGRIHFYLADAEWGEGGQVWEVLPAGDLVLHGGGVSGRFEGSVIEASGKATVWYGATSTSCPSADYRFTFTRR